jgi:HSP20 family protein
MVWEDPFEELERMRRMMREAFRRMGEVEETVFPVDISETTDEIIVRADLPGFKKDEVSIKATENTVEILAQHKEKKVEKTETVFKAERRFGAARRFLTLPTEILPETAKASMEDGVLEIRFKKAKAKKVREIKVQ